MGPAPAGGEHLGGRPAERSHRDRLRERRCRSASRRIAPRFGNCPRHRCWPGPTNGWTSITCRSRPPHESLRAEIRRAVNRARTRTSDRALPRFTQEHAGPTADHRGSTADDQGERRRRRHAGRSHSTSTSPPWPRTGAGRWAATPSSTSRTRWSGSAASACARTSRCWRAAARTTWCSCSSSRLGGRCWPSTCTANPPGTRIRDSGWWSTSRPCRRSATRCWAGPPRTAGSTTSGSSGT